MSTELIEAFRNGIRPPFRGEVYDFAANVDLQKGYAIRGNFNVAITKYLMEPMKALLNPVVRQVNCLKAVQTGGSLAMADLYVLYIMVHDPGDLLWAFAQGDDFAKTYASERISPNYSAADCLQPLLRAAGRFGITSDAISLPTMSAMITGLNSSSVHGLSKRFVIVDECWRAVEGKAGLIGEAKSRTKGYPKTSKIVLISQGGIKGTDWANEWSECTKHHWAWQCDACKKHQVFEFTATRPDGSFAGMRWERNGLTYPNGRWNYTEAAKTARLECFHCGAQTDDTPAARRRLDDTHAYVASTDCADASNVGYQWPSIAKPDISFASIVTRYLKAKDQESYGSTLGLIQFYQQELAINWDHEQSSLPDVARLHSAPYEVKGDWDKEKFRFMTVDCQKDFLEFWFVVRAWSATGESRQLDRGKLESWEQVAAKQREWLVKDQNVYVDAGYRQTEVVDQAIHNGHIGWRAVNGKKIQVWLCWNVLKGSRMESFEHPSANTKSKELRIYDKGRYLAPTRLPAAVGKSKVGVPFFMFSALHVSDILRKHRDCEAAPWLCLPDAADKSDPLSFTNQMHSHERVTDRDERGMPVNIWRPISMGGDGKINTKRPGHYFDAEKMQIVAALRCGVIGGHQEIGQQPEAAQ